MSSKLRLAISCSLAVVGLLVASAGAGRAGEEGLDIQAELRKPGTRLLVVEFYADWCVPCKKSVPRWNKIQKQYKDRGLRFIVVSTGSSGLCDDPGWRPDRIVCDFDQSIQEFFGADSLPQAFLFTWQGEFLLRTGSVDLAERTIADYFKQSPRIFISEPTDQKGERHADAKGIRALIRNHLSLLSKFEIVADENTARELRKLKKKSYEMNFDQKDHCELGQDVSPNSKLEIRLFEWSEKQRIVILELYSIERSCMVQAVKVRVGKRGLEAALFEAASSLVDKLIGQPDRSRFFRKAPEQKPEPTMTLRENRKAPPPSSVVRKKSRVKVQFHTSPSGATIFLDGRKMEAVTPCEFELFPGKYQVRLGAVAGYSDLVFSRSFLSPEMVFETLPPASGEIAITAFDEEGTELRGISVLLDGNVLGRVPLLLHGLPPGLQRFTFEGPGFLLKSVRKFVDRNKQMVLSTCLKEEPSTGVIEVGHALLSDGNRMAMMRVDVSIAGHIPQTSWATFELEPGSYQVAVESDASMPRTKVYEVMVYKNRTTYLDPELKADPDSDKWRLLTRKNVRPR